MYSLSVNTSHIFCVSPYRIIAHNGAPGIITATVTAAISIVFPPAAPIAIGSKAVISAIIAGIGCYCAYKKHQKHRTFAQLREESKNNSYNNNNPKKPDDEEDLDNEHPHGIYEEAPYHHKYSINDKSPCPENGQKCLDYSLRVKDGLRVAIENNKFVILRQTSFRKFHGYVVSWDNVHASIRVILRKNGLVTKTGKIIKHITQKALS